MTGKAWWAGLGGSSLSWSTFTGNCLHQHHHHHHKTSSEKWCLHKHWHLLFTGKRSRMRRRQRRSSKRRRRSTARRMWEGRWWMRRKPILSGGLVDQKPGTASPQIWRFPNTFPSAINCHLSWHDIVYMNVLVLKHCCKTQEGVRNLHRPNDLVGSVQHLLYKVNLPFINLHRSWSCPKMTSWWFL